MWCNHGDVKVHVGISGVYDLGSIHVRILGNVWCGNGSNVFKFRNTTTESGIIGIVGCNCNENVNVLGITVAINCSDYHCNGDMGCKGCSH